MTPAVLARLSWMLLALPLALIALFVSLAMWPLVLQNDAPRLVLIAYVTGVSLASALLARRPLRSHPIRRCRRSLRPSCRIRHYQLLVLTSGSFPPIADISGLGLLSTHCGL